MVLYHTCWLNISQSTKNYTIIIKKYKSNKSIQKLHKCIDEILNDRGILEYIAEEANKSSGNHQFSAHDVEKLFSNIKVKSGDEEETINNVGRRLQKVNRLYKCLLYVYGGLNRQATALPPRKKKQIVADMEFDSAAKQKIYSPSKQVKIPVFYNEGDEGQVNRSEESSHITDRGEHEDDEIQDYSIERAKNDRDWSRSGIKVSLSFFLIFFIQTEKPLLLSLLTIKRNGVLGFWGNCQKDEYPFSCTGHRQEDRWKGTWNYHNK